MEQHKIDMDSIREESEKKDREISADQARIDEMLTKGILNF